jgi:pimeloyl-ACP methyl ester carboxylesterase
MNNSKYINLCFFVFISLMVSIFFGCSRDLDAPKPVEEKHLVNFSLKSEFGKEMISDFAVLMGYPDFTKYVKYDIEIYKINYKTEINNNEVIASGVIVLPKGWQGPIPLLSAQRGTMFAHTNAPSETRLVYGFELISTAGYATIMSDMIGFGSTKNLPQYYYNKQANSQVVIDMIKAGKEFLIEKNIGLTGELFLFGYSQGGYTTLAAQQKIETDPYLDWNINAVAAGAGAYDIEFIMEDILDKGVFTSPSFLSLLVYSYNRVNGFNSPMKYYFKEPYASQIPILLDGSMNQKQINDKLPDTLSEFFQELFLERMKDRTQIDMIKAFRANSVHNWKPISKTRLYHSLGDQYVPFSASQKTAQEMRSKGADVSFETIGNRTHEESAIQMVTKVVPWFESIRKIS